MDNFVNLITNPPIVTFLIGALAGAYLTISIAKTKRIAYLGDRD